MVVCHRILLPCQLILSYEKASFRSTQDSTSHLDLPSILRISLSKGVAVFLLIILVLSNLKSTTGLLFLVPFLATSITGDVWVVLFFDNIPKDTSLAIYLSITDLSSSWMGKGLDKEWGIIHNVYVYFNVRAFTDLISSAKCLFVILN